MKKIMVQISIAGLSASQYEGVWNDLRNSGYSQPKGLLKHYSAVDGDHWLIMEIWESEGHFNDFGQVLTPLLVKNGVPKLTLDILDLYYIYEGAATNAAQPNP